MVNEEESLCLLLQNFCWTFPMNYRWFDSRVKFGAGEWHFVVFWPLPCLTAERQSEVRVFRSGEGGGRDFWKSGGSELHCSNWALAQPTDGDRKRQRRGGRHDERCRGSLSNVLWRQQAHKNTKTIRKQNIASPFSTKYLSNEIVLSWLGCVLHTKPVSSRSGLYLKSCI